jgi:hypothetical protein
MSYNYEINHNILQKKSNASKYTYTNNGTSPQIYIFELILKDKSDNINIIRHIRKCNQGNIVSDEDNIKYDLINKYKLTVIDVNYPDKVIFVEELLDHSLTMNTFYNNNIYLEISQNINKLLCFNYKINTNNSP